MKKVLKAGALVLAVGLVIVGVTSSDDPKKEITVAEQSAAQETTKEIETTTKEKKETKEQSVEVLNQKGVVITAKGLSEDLFDKGINLEAKNNSKKDVIVEIESVSVDGVMVNAFYYEDIKKGKVSKKRLYIYLEDGELSEASEIEFTIRVHNAKTYDTILEETKVLNLK